MAETFFDSHAHYHASLFTEECIEDSLCADVLLPRLFREGLSGVVDIGTDIETSHKALALAKKYPHIYAAVGMYPHSCPLPHSDEQMEEIISRFDAMLNEEKVVAIGEIGLDFHWDTVPRDIQLKWFARQMALARERGVPVIIHDREAHGAVFDVLCRYPDVVGVLHCYSGSAEMARQLVKMGYCISVSGVVTYKNARALIEVVEQIPLEYLLIETDCPYLTPHPHRGKPNHSGYLPLVISRIAEIKGVSCDEVCRITRENTKKIFKIREKG